MVVTWWIVTFLYSVGGKMLVAKRGCEVSNNSSVKYQAKQC